MNNSNEVFELQSELPLAGKGLSYSKKEWKRIYGYEVGLVSGAKFVKKDKAVNEYDKLKEDNAALQKALTTLTGMYSTVKEDNARLIEYAKKVLQYPKGSKGYDPVDAINLEEAIKKAESK